MSILLNRMEIVIIILCCLHLASTAPVQDTVKRPGRVPRMQGCFYNAAHFENGEQIITNEPCLNCTCVDSTLMCYLRVCPFLKPVGEKCIEEKSKGDCCPKIWCPEVVKEKDCDDPKHEGKHDHPGCYLDKKYYPDGAMLPHDPKKPCEVCYCIRNSTSCVIQECELKVDGCTPVYKEGQCCPCRYNCSYDESTTIAPPGVTVQDLSEGCVLSDGRFIEDGEAVNSTNPCEHCYCMRNEVVCAIQECQAPGDNCRPLAPKSGQCCPDRYECPSGGIISSSPAISFSSVFTTDDITTPKTSVKGYGIKTSSQKGIGIKGGASKSSSLKPAGVKGVFSEPHSIKSSIPSSSTSSVFIAASIDQPKKSIYDTIEDATMYELETVKTETSTLAFYETSSGTPEVIITKDQSYATPTSSHSATQEIYAESTSQQTTKIENLTFATENNSNLKVTESFEVIPHVHAETTATDFVEETSKTPEKPVLTEEISKVTTATSVTSEENAKISSLGTKLQGVKGGFKKETDSKEIGSKTVASIKGQLLVKENDTFSEFPKFGVKSVGPENERVKGGSHQSTTSFYDKAGITKHTSTIDSLSLFVESSNAQFVQPSSAKNEGQLLLVASEDETAEATLDAHSLPMGILTKGGNRSVVAQITGIFRPSIPQETKFREQNKTEAPDMTADIKPVGIKSTQATGFGVKGHPIYPPRERPMLPIGAIPGEHKIPTSSKNRPAVVAIPGEGGCRVGKIMYRNGQPMPSFNACKMNCQCINSVVYCDDVACEIPGDSQNCVRIKIPGECCSKYLCGSTSIQSTQSASTSKSTASSTEFREEVTQEPKSTMAELTKDVLLNEKFASDNKQSITESILTTQSQTNQSSLSDTSEPPKILTTTHHTLFTVPSTLFTEENTEGPKSTMSAFTEEEVLLKETHAPDYETLITENGLITHSQTDQSIFNDISKSSEVEPIIALDTSSTKSPTPYTTEKAEERKSTMSEFTEEDISQKKMHTPDYDTSVTESSLTTQTQTDQNNLSDMSLSSQVQPIIVRDPFITTQPTQYTEKGTEKLKSTMSEFTEEILLKQTHSSDYEPLVTESILTNQSQTDQSSLSDISTSSEAESTTINKTFTIPSTQLTEENTHGPKATTVEFNKEEVLFKEKHTSGHEAPATEILLTTQSQTDQSSMIDTSLSSKIKSTTDDSVTVSSLQITKRADSNEAETQTTLIGSTSDNSEETYSESTKEFSSQTTSKEITTEKSVSSEIDLQTSTSFAEHFHDVSTHQTLTSLKVKEPVSDKIKTASDYFSPTTATSKIEETTDVPKKQEDSAIQPITSRLPISSDKDLFHSETTTASLMSQTLTIQSSADFTEHEISTAEDKFSSVQGSDSLNETTILLEEITETNPSNDLTTLKTYTDIITRDKEKYFQELSTHSTSDITTKPLQEDLTSAQNIDHTEDTSHTEEILHKDTVHPKEPEHVHGFTIPESTGIEKTTNEISDATKRDFLAKTTTKHFSLHEITTEREGSTYETKYNKLTTPFYSTTIPKITKEYSNAEDFTNMITSNASEATEFHPIITTEYSEIEDKSTSSISTLSNEEPVSKTTVIPVSIKSTSEETSEITENDSSRSPTSDIPSEIMHEHFITIIGSADNEGTFIKEIEKDSISSVISRETQPSFIPSSITEFSKQLISQTAQPFSATATAKYSEMTDHYSENAEFPKETTISSGEVFESLNNLETATKKNSGKLETSKSVTPSISTEILQEKSTLASITQTSTESLETTYSETTKLYSEKTGSSEEITVSSEFSEITSSGEDSKYSTPSSFYAESTIKDEIQITTKTAHSTSTYPDKIQTDEALYKDVKSSTAYDSSSKGSLYENDHSSTITYTEESSSLSQSVESEDEINVNSTTTLLLEHPTSSHAYSSSTENDNIFKEKTSELSEHSKTTVSTFHEKAETSRPFQKLNTDLPDKSHGISIADPNQSSYPATSNEKIELDSMGLVLTSEINKINETLKQEDSTNSTEHQDIKAMILELDKELNIFFNPEKQSEEVTGSSFSESAFDLVTKVSTVGNNETTQTSNEDVHTTFTGTIKTDSLETERTEFPPTTMSGSLSNTFHETSTPHDTVIQTETVPMASIKGPENLVLHTESKTTVSSPTTATYLTTLNKITNFTVIDDHNSNTSKYTTSSFEIKTTSPDPSTLKLTESSGPEIVFIDPITKTPPQLESTTKTEATAETSKLSEAEIEITKSTLVSTESKNAGKTVSYTAASNLKETESTVIDVTTHNHFDTAITAKDSYTAEEITQTPNILQILDEVATPSSHVSFFDSTHGNIVSDVNINLGGSTVGNDLGSSDSEEYSSELSESIQHTNTHSGSQEPATSLKSIASEETAPTAGNIEFGTETNDFEKTFTLNTNYLETKSTPIENDEEAATHPFQVQVTVDDLSYNDSHVDQFTIRYDVFDSTQVSINEDTYTTYKDKVSEVTKDSMDKWVEVEISTQDAEIASTESPDNFNSVTTEKSKKIYDTPLSISENTESSKISDSTHISFVTEISELTTQHSERDMAVEVTQPRLEESSLDFMIGPEGVINSSNTEISYVTSTYNETSELFEFLQNKTQTTVIETTEMSTNLPATFIKHAHNISEDIGTSISNGSVIPTEKTDNSPLYTPTETTDTKKASSTGIVVETETDQTTISNVSEESFVSTFDPIQTQTDNATEIYDVKPTESSSIADVSETTSVSMSLPILLTSKKEDQSTMSDNAVNTTVSGESALNESVDTQSNEIENNLLTKSTEIPFSTPKAQNMFAASVFEETSQKFETTQNIKLSTVFEKDTESETYFPTEMEENVLLVSTLQSTSERTTTVSKPNIILSSVSKISDISGTLNQSKDHESYVPPSKTTAQLLETSQAISNKENPSTFRIPDSTVTTDAESRPTFTENSTNFPIEKYEQTLSEVISTTLRTQLETTKYPLESLQKTIVTDILPASTETQTSSDLEHIQTFTTTKNVDIEDINSIYGSMTSNFISETAKTIESSDSTVSESKKSSIELSTKAAETTSHFAKTDDYTSSVTDIPVLEHNISQSLAMQDIKKVETDLTDLTNESTLSLFSSTPKSHETPTAITDHSEDENKDSESKTAASAAKFLTQTMENTDTKKIILSTSMIPGKITEVFQSTKIGITREIFDAATSTIPTDLKDELAVSAVMENTMEEDKRSDITDTENKTPTLTLEQTKEGNELDLPHDSTTILESEISEDASPTLTVDESEVSQAGAFTTQRTSEASTETTVGDKITTFNGYDKSQTISSLEEPLVETTVTMSPQVPTDELTHHVTNMTPKVTETSSTYFTKENASGSTELDHLSDTLSINTSVSSIKETQIKTKTSPIKAPSEVAQTTPYYTTKVNHITKNPEIVTLDNEGEDVKLDRFSTSLISKVTESSHLSSTATTEYGSTETEVVTETSEINKNKTSIMLEFETKTTESITHPSKTQNVSVPFISEVTSEATQKEMSTAESHTEIHDITTKYQTEITETPKRIYTSTSTEILSEENQNHSESIDTSTQSETMKWPTTFTAQRIKTIPSSLNIKHEETAQDTIMVSPKTTTVFSTYFPSHLTELSSVSQDADGNEFTSLITESSINEIASIIDLKSQSTITLDKDLIVETTLSPLQSVITQNVTSDIDITTKASQTTQKAHADDVTDSKTQYTTTSIITDLSESSSSLNRTIHESHIPETLLMTQEITDTSTIEVSDSDSTSTAKVTQSSSFSETSAVTTETLTNLTEQSSIASTVQFGNDIFVTDIVRLTTEFEEIKSTEDSYRYSETPSTTLQIETTASTSDYTEDKKPVSTDLTSTKFIQSENTLKEIDDENTLLPAKISSISDKSTTILIDRENLTETTEIIQSTKTDSVTENSLTKTASIQTTNVAAHSLSTQNASIHIVSEITSGPSSSTQSITPEDKTGSDDNESITPVEIFTFSPTTEITQPVDAKSDAHSKGSSVIPTENYDSSSSEVTLSTTLHSFSDNTYGTKYVDTDTSTIISNAETKEPTSIPIHFNTTYTQTITAITNETFEYTRNISVDKEDDDENLIPSELSVDKDNYLAFSTDHSYQKFSESDATIKPLNYSQITHFDSKNASETDMSFAMSSTEAMKEIIDSSTMYTVHPPETKAPADILITNFPDDIAESTSWSEKPKTTFTESVTERPKETAEYIHDGSVLPEKETEVSQTVLPPTIIEDSSFFQPQHERSTTLETTKTTETSYDSSPIEHKHESTERVFSTEKPLTTDYYPTIQDQSNTSEIDSKSSMLIITRESTRNETYTSLKNDTSIEFPIYSEASVFEATEKSTKLPTDNESYTSETIDKSTETKSEEILNAHEIGLPNLTISEYLSNFTISAFTENDNNQKEIFTETSQSIKETGDTFGTKSEEVTFKPSDITFKYVTTTASLFTSEIQDFTYENTNSVSGDSEEAKTVTNVSELETHTTEIDVTSIDNLPSVSLENNQSLNEYGSNDVFDIPKEVHSKINNTLNVEEDKTYNISTPNILPSTSDLFERTTSELFEEEEFTEGSMSHELHDNSKDETVTEPSTKRFDIGVSVTTEHENFSKISIDTVNDILITSDESEVSTQIGSKFSTMGSDMTLPPNKSTVEDSEMLSTKFADEISVSENTIHDYLSTTAHSSPDSILTLKLTTPPPQLSILLENKFDSSHLKKNETQDIENISPENILFNFTTKYDEKKFNASTKLSPAQQGYLRPIPGEHVIPASTTLSTQHVYPSPIPGEGVVPDTTHEDFLDELGSLNETTYTISQTTIHIPISSLHESEDALSNIKQTFFPLRNNTVLKVPDATHQFVLGDSLPITSTSTDIVQHVESKYPGESSPSPGWVAHPLHEDLVKKLSTVFPSSPATIVHEIHNLHSTTVSGESFTQSQEDDGVCYFEGGVYLSSEQIPRTDTCEFCFCFKGDIICLQQTCPPPIKGCYAIPIEGFCCPRFHCPVKQTWFNVSAATTTTTIVPFGHVSHKTHSTPGCQIEGKSYLLHQVVQASSNPCMLCRCDYGGIMKCDPRSCKPDAPMIEEIAEAYSKKRR